jgi:hypothetical protein
VATLFALGTLRLAAGDPSPTQPPGAVNPPFHGAGLNQPFPDNYYGADHGGSSLALSYPFTSPWGGTDHSRGVVSYYCAPFTPRNSEGVYGMDVWLEASTGGDWSPSGENGGLADGAGSAYCPVNTPNPGPSPAYQFQWTFDSTPFPPNTSFRVFIYVYLYNQGGGSQGNFYVASSLGTVTTGTANDPPVIAWDSAFGSVNPAAVSAGQSYTISASATDDNGNLAAVQIWRNGQPFAASGGGDGWAASAAAGAADPAGTVAYTAQATDAAGAVSNLISLSVSTAGLQPQPAVVSLDATLTLGQSFTPTELGGAGSGGWQFAIGDYTNFNGGATNDSGTDLPSGGWVPAWTPPAAGSYAFWISHNGDASYSPSAIAGPYTLTVVAPPPPPPTPAPDPPAPTPAPVPTPPAPAPPVTDPPVTVSTPAPVSAPTDPAPSNPVVPPPAPTPSAPTTPSVPPVLHIARIRFDPTGHSAIVRPAPPGGWSALWTDPAGVAASPWPSFSGSAPATVTTGTFTLPTQWP